MKKENITNELSPEEIDAEKLKRRKRIRRKKVGRVIDRIFGFILATGIMFGVAGLGLEYVLVKGPSSALSETFTMTMLETRRFRFIPNIFLTEDEVAEIVAKKNQKVEAEFDSSLINIPGEDGTPTEGEENKPDYHYTEDEDGDGYILEEIKRKNFVGYMITVLDPSRVFVGMPDYYGGSGLVLEQYVKKYDAIGGINGGGYYDPSGAGLGGQPNGLTIIGGECYNEVGTDSFVGFDDKGVMYTGYFTYDEAKALNIRDGVTFGPILIMNGVPTDPYSLSSGVNPRTAIGQRADGAVLMLCVDGRQAHSVGCTFQDLCDIMLDYGAVNACNLDGGSSSAMYLNGEYINSSSAGVGSSRLLPNAFLFK